MTAIDIISNEPVLQVKAASYNNNCSDAKVEAFLAEQLLQHFDIQQRIEKQLKVKMPEGYKCT